MALLALDTRDVVEEAVVTTICCVEKLGVEQCKAYVHKSVIKDWNTSIYEAIKMNSLQIFKHNIITSKAKEQAD